MSPEPQPVRLSVNQLVALNVTRWRKAAGLTQAELGERLGMPGSDVSALERSGAPGKRPRRFDADALIGLAGALDVPLAALFLPPDGDGHDIVMPEPLTGAGWADLMAYLFPDPGAAGSAYADAFAAAVRRHMDEPRGAELIRYLDEMNGRERRAELAARLDTQAGALRTVLADLESAREAIRQEDAADGRQEG